MVEMKFLNDMGNFPEYRATFEKIHKENIVERMWLGDVSCWKGNPAEIGNRLGWLNLPEYSVESIPKLERFAKEIWVEGFERVLLLGMGGSSLAPELFAAVFNNGETGIPLRVLDSTDPVAVARAAEWFDGAKTLCIASSKSGGTVETLSFLKYFFEHHRMTLPGEEPGNRFVVITDPGSRLEELARKLQFRKIFFGDPDTGGRFSALSAFGLVPAVLSGVNIDLLLKKAEEEATNSRLTGLNRTGPVNRAVKLASFLSANSQAGRDKATFFISSSIASFGDWVEQLLAESTGKDGKGILPVMNETSTDPEYYSSDRMFIHLKTAEDDCMDDLTDALAQRGAPVMRIELNDIYDLGGQFFLWEAATALAGSILGINPFDQPNVESAKIQARQMVRNFVEKRELPPVEWNEVNSDALPEFLAMIPDGGYVAIHIWMAHTGELDTAVSTLRSAVAKKTGVPVTVGYGPRFLHSTGQLHKGDAGAGLFIQLTGQLDRDRDIPIPDDFGSSSSSITFGVLRECQAAGDRIALDSVSRKVIGFRLGTDSVHHIDRLILSLG